MTLTDTEFFAQELLNVVEGAKIDDKPNNIMIQVGEKVAKLYFIETDHPDLQSALRDEFAHKLEAALRKAYREMNEKYTNAINRIQTKERELYDREQKVSKVERSAFELPNLSDDLIIKGLSYTKTDRGDVYWFYRGLYSPKTINGKPIEAKIVKKNTVPVVIRVTTSGKNVTNVSVLNAIGFGFFDHYHDGCWGSWNFPKTYDHPEDILNICETALNVLSDVNSLSVVHRSPRGLSRLSTLLKNAREPKETDVKLTTAQKRMGITNQAMNEVGGGWST